MKNRQGQLFIARLQEAQKHALIIGIPEIWA